ncbi:MAG TPA: nucleotide sugar dehydrogenase [Candidatus Brocadiia bacterium]|nr:nucleotide sugar dehydrogenase [Candidatus Brocadiia bacterium]
MQGKLVGRKASVGVIGLGYVGLPLAMEFCSAGYSVTGFDIDPEKPKALIAGRSYIEHIPSERIRKALETKRFGATSDFTQLTGMDAIVICVPTPLTRHREPDMTYIEQTTATVAKYLRAGQIIVLESTTYPGTTEEVMRPMLEARGLKVGKDFFLAFSPEREDPANKDFGTGNIPKVVGGTTKNCLALARLLYDGVVKATVPVSSTQTAEAVKLTENIFRCVNIALVNELKVVFDRMGIDVWEVIEAAKTKPFGYMPFYPGPGLGGHCIPIDPFYLTWKAREYDSSTKFIELAGEVNTAMPEYVITRMTEALNLAGKSLKGAKVLVLGLAYKKNVDDTRESPSLKLMELIEKKHARADYCDPHVRVIPPTREHPDLAGRKSVTLTPASLKRYDVVLVATDHSCFDYDFICRHARMVLDTRNATAGVKQNRKKIVKA